MSPLVFASGPSLHVLKDRLGRRVVDIERFGGLHKPMHTLTIVDPLLTSASNYSLSFSPTLLYLLLFLELSKVTST